MYDVGNFYYLIVSLQMEIENVSNRSNNISVSAGVQNMMHRYGTDQKAIRYNGNIVYVSIVFLKLDFDSAKASARSTKCRRVTSNA